MNTIQKRKLSYQQFKKGIEQQLQSSGNVLKNTIAYGEYFQLPLKENLIFYESNHGTGLLGKPKSIFLEALKDSSVKHIWSCTSENITMDLSYYKSLGNVSFVEPNSPEYFEYLATAKYLITDSYFSASFTKREEQVLICTGNNSTLSSCGYDKGILQMPTEQLCVRHFMQADYIISDNEDYQKNILEKSYKLNNIYKGKIINHYLSYNPLYSLPSIKETTKKFNGEKIILLLPALDCQTSEEIAASANYFSQVLELLSTDNILISVPANAYEIFKDNLSLANYLLPPSFDCRDFIPQIDYVITDANRLFSDFLLNNVPVYFIKNPIWDNQFDSTMLKYYNIHFYPLDDIMNTETKKTIPELNVSSQESIWDIIRYPKNNYNISYIASCKKRIVFFANFLANSNNNAYLYLLNLLDWIDYDTFDVTLIASSFKNNDNQLIGSINKHVRYLDYSGRIIYNKEEYATHRYLCKYLYHMDNSTNIIHESIFNIYNRNSQRICGNTEFDTAIVFGNFSKKDYLFDFGIPAKKRIFISYQERSKEKAMWVENAATAFTFENKLHIYDSFDQILYVSPGLRNQNILSKDNVNDTLLDYIPVLPSNTQLLVESTELRIATYDNKEYCILPITKKTFQTEEILLLPKVPSDQTSLLHIVCDNDPKKLIAMIDAFSALSEKENICLYFVDNYNYIDESITTYIAQHSLSEKIMILQNVFLTNAYTKQFNYILSMNAMPSIDYNNILSTAFHIPVVNINNCQLTVIDSSHTPSDYWTLIKEKLSSLF
ncbi:CDP-glycerol glycerophosphotransferase family protein [Anaerostipes faecalis]|uniref:CDP-glycerol glycerophosphotransferase family protein n=1 Tax=Anaerostipes faecalis TaxID=2738446 RepID=UPI003F001CEC